MPILSSPSPAIHRCSHGASGKHLAILVLALCTLLSGHGLAENPWNSSMGWSSTPTGAWSSWDATSGGSFGNPFSSHHFTHTAPMVTGAPPPSAIRATPPTTVRDGQIDPVMLKAASIAEQRALPRGTSKCWRFVKEALLAAGGVSSYPQTAYARDAGRELVENYGFVRLAVRSAESAPVGSVLVYGGAGAGHVELRTARGFASDYRCSRPAALPFIGAYARLSGHRHGNETAQVIPAVAAGS